MATATKQTREEIITNIGEAGKVLEQKGWKLADLQSNGLQIHGYILDKLDGDFSTANILTAIGKLKESLSFDKRPIREGQDKVYNAAQARKEAAEKEAKQAEKTANDTASPEFIARNKKAEAAVDNLISTYLVITASGRVNHAVTQDRRSGLRGIQVRLPGTDGKVVIDWARTYGMVQEAIAGMQKQDDLGGRR